MQKERISIPEAYLGMAYNMAARSTCIDKQVGCILTNDKDQIIATGFNGTPNKIRHCSHIGYCRKDHGGPCLATHAEQNALIQCRVPEQIHAAYVTLSPCIVCIKMLMNTPCKYIYFGLEHSDPEPYTLWKTHHDPSITWVQVDI